METNNPASYLNSLGAPDYAAMANIAAGKEFTSNQTIEQRNSFNVNDPVMKKFGAEVGQDGVARFTPGPQTRNQGEHQQMFFPGASEDLLKSEAHTYNNLPANIKERLFASKSGFYDGVSSDASENMVGIALRRQADESFFAMGP